LPLDGHAGNNNPGIIYNELSWYSKLTGCMGALVPGGQCSRWTSVNRRPGSRFDFSSRICHQSELKTLNSDQYVCVVIEVFLQYKSFVVL